MKQNENSINKIDKAIAELEIRMKVIENQGILNSGLVGSFHQALSEIRLKLKFNETISIEIKQKWNEHMAAVHRFFESDPLEEILYEIDEMLGWRKT